MPDNADLEDPISITISNVGNGEEYLNVQQGPSDSFRGVSLQITEINWPHIRAGIDTMIGLCNVPEEKDEPKVDPVFAKTEE